MTRRTGIQKKSRMVIEFVLLGLAVALVSGCAGTGMPGNGTTLSLQETQSERQYYVYLPQGYDENNSYPVVLAIHCIKPFDDADRQIRDWERIADEYGFIVAAPVLATPNPVPLWFNHVSGTMKRDEEVTMNVLEQVLKDTAADPDRVFITSLSSGGAMMHYLANKYPGRFAGLCARGCWFNENILSEDNARGMAEKGFAVMIQYAEHDNTNIKHDSWKAIRWYEEMGFEVESAVIGQSLRLPGMGHMAGTFPDRAGEFFNRCIEASKSQ